MTRYRTVARPSSHEPDKVKGSRFIADVAPAPDVAAAEAFVERVRARFPDASHVCYAWSIGVRGETTRAHDDGEPSGSAGRPILAQIEGHGVTGVVLCVTRYFGGTKLGVGGLMRAYGGAAGQALDRADIVEREVTEVLELRFPYDCSGAVKSVLHGHALEARAADYGAEVRMTLEVPDALVGELERELVDRTGGRARIRRGAGL